MPQGEYSKGPICPISNIMKSFDCGLRKKLLVFSGQNVFSKFPNLVEELTNKLGYLSNL